MGISEHMNIRTFEHVTTVEQTNIRTSKFLKNSKDSEHSNTNVRCSVAPDYPYDFEAHQNLSHKKFLLKVHYFMDGTE